jgi:pSer/pThr/pTyr-binding forkhead associated (FHA) protein
MRLYELFEDLPGLPGLMNIPKSPVINATKPNTTNTTGNVAQPTTNNTASTPITPTTQQQFTKGTIVSIPDGPSNTKTNLKISAVDSNNKTITVMNPLRPNDPALTYKQEDFANILSGQGK